MPVFQSFDTYAVWLALTQGAAKGEVQCAVVGIGGDSRGRLSGTLAARKQFEGGPVGAYGLVHYECDFVLLVGPCHDGLRSHRTVGSKAQHPYFTRLELDAEG